MGLIQLRLPIRNHYNRGFSYPHIHTFLAENLHVTHGYRLIANLKRLLPHAKLCCIANTNVPRGVTARIMNTTALNPVNTSYDIHQASNHGLGSATTLRVLLDKLTYH